MDYNAQRIIELVEAIMARRSAKALHKETIADLGYIKLYAAKLYIKLHTDKLWEKSK